MVFKREIFASEIASIYNERRARDSPALRAGVVPLHLWKVPKK